MIDRVKIGDIEYAIKEVDEPTWSNPDGTNQTKYLYGTVSHIDNVIQVREGLTPQMKRVTVIHEILHGLSNQNAYEHEEVEERMTQSLAYGIVALLRNNPELVRYLTE